MRSARSSADSLAHGFAVFDANHFRAISDAVDDGIRHRPFLQFGMSARRRELKANQEEPVPRRLSVISSGSHTRLPNTVCIALKALPFIHSPGFWAMFRGSPYGRPDRPPARSLLALPLEGPGGVAGAGGVSAEDDR